MAIFQGSGFSLDLPDGVMDASSYVFVRDDRSSVPAMLRIAFGSMDTSPEDIQSYVDEKLALETAANPNITLQGTTVHTRDNWRYAVTNLEWGETPNDIREQRIYMLVDESPQRWFTLTLSATQATFADALEFFSPAIRTFKENEQQKLLPDFE